MKITRSRGGTGKRPWSGNNPLVISRAFSPAWRAGVAMVDEDMLTPKQAASRLGVTPTTLYDWLGRSRRGLFVLRGRPVIVEYFQTGAKGQGRIRIATKEVDRLRELMRVPVEPTHSPRPSVRRNRFPGITVPLGRPG
ncbi:MAG: helix-turn-helix domain-containing protein [Planctomycetes bacterium]|nr:helix-turn-helix domain-containing protein [Planctomycetota bacterium]